MVTDKDVPFWTDKTEERRRVVRGLDLCAIQSDWRLGAGAGDLRICIAKLNPAGCNFSNLPGAEPGAAFQ